MRTLALLLALAACGSDDTGDDGPGPDGGADLFVGSYTAAWATDEPWPNVTIDLAPGGDDTHAMWLWASEPRPGQCDGTDCETHGGDIVDGCLDDGFAVYLCVSGVQLVGAIRPVGAPERVGVTLTRR